MNLPTQSKTIMSLVPKLIRQSFTSSMLLAILLVEVLTWNICVLVEMRNTDISYSFLYRLWTATLMTPGASAPFFSWCWGLGLCAWLYKLREARVLMTLQIMGVTRARLLRIVMPHCVIIILMMGLVQAFFAPWLANYARSISLYRHGYTPSYQGKGIWLKQHDGFFHVKNIVSTDHWQDIIYVKSTDPKHYQYLHIDDLTYQNKQYWKAKGVTEININHKNEKNQQKFDEKLMPLRLKPSVLHWLELKPSLLDIRQLWYSLIHKDHWKNKLKYGWSYLWGVLWMPIHLFIFSCVVMMGLQRDVVWRHTKQPIMVAWIFGWILMDFLLKQYLIDMTALSRFYSLVLSISTTLTVGGLWLQLRRIAKRI